MHLNDLDSLPEHDAGEGNGVEAFENYVETFVILDETSALFGSREGTPDDPASWQDNEAALGLGQAHNRQCDAVLLEAAGAGFVAGMPAPMTTRPLVTEHPDRHLASWHRCIDKLRGRAGTTTKRAGRLVRQCRTARAGKRHRSSLLRVLWHAPAAYARRITGLMSG